MSRLRERQAQQLPQNHAPSGTAIRLEHSPRRDNRPNTAGQVARPKVTCQMLNETERMLLKAPNRHKSMLSAGKRYADILGRCRLHAHVITSLSSVPLALSRFDFPHGELANLRPIG